ncbi:MAG: zinc-binding dehydrogenase, partial [Propionibacterium sp.]|nr:zinc-binding dehydrogenase [Propionibacterium sp.]
AGAGQVIVTNRSAHRRELALRLGATRALDPATEDVRAAVVEATGGRGADVVIVAVGAAELAGQALALAGIGGRVSYFAGFPKGSTAEVDANLIHYNELIVTGGSNARRADVVRAVDLLSAGVIDAESLVTNQVPLSRFEEAIALVSGRTGVKTAVVPG